MSKAPSRGRPSTLDQDQIVETAVMQYWANDPLDVSINDICKLTGASKPGVYRAFGSDDGLKTKALEALRQPVPRSSLVTNTILIKRIPPRLRALKNK